MKSIVVAFATVASFALAACSANTSPSTDDDAELKASGPTSLRMALIAEPIRANGTSKNVLISSFNAQLKAAGATLNVDGYTAYPDFVDLKSDAAVKTYNDLRDAFSTAAEKAKIGFDFFGDTGPESYQYKINNQPVLCYTGSAAKIADAIYRLEDPIFSEQLGIWAWRYKAEKHYLDADETAFAPDAGADGIAVPAAWKEWKGDGESILLLTHEGDDGDDVESSVIPRCSSSGS
jgi:hypothetical protein